MSIRLRLFGDRDNPESPLQRVATAQALFDEAVAKAQRAGGTRSEENQKLISETSNKLKEFTRYATDLERGGQALTQRDQDDLLALARRRAYLLPKEELGIEADALMVELREWGVPASSLDALQRLAAKCEGDEKVARAALHKLLEEYDYWDMYVDWYLSQAARVSLALGAGGLLAFAVALTLCLSSHVLPGVFFAAASGASLSILSKLPPMTTYGDAVSLLLLRVGTRFFSGILASATGLWLISTGIVRIGLGDDTNLAATASKCLNADPTCQHVSLLMLLALAVLFGFSERALASFESAVLPAAKGEKSAPGEKA